jgi:hypothetical protein
VRVPLTGVYNTRPGTGVLSGTLSIVGIAIVGSVIVGSSNQGSSKDYRMLNCVQITETDQLSNTKRLYVVKRPGFAATSTPASGSIGNAIHVWAGQGSGTKIMSCFGGTNSTLYDSTTSKGAITGKANGITETSISGTATLTICSSDSTGWYYQDGGSVTKISDSDFPGNASRSLAGNFAHMDGYAFVMDITGRVYNSDLNSVTAWTAGSFITANSTPDVGVGVVRHRNTIIAFCKGHLDVFRNAGNTSGSPLTRIEELSRLIGGISADAITRLRDTIYFVGSTEGANLALYAYNGGQVDQVSTPEIEAALGIAGPANISTTTLGFYGRHFVVVNASTSTFAYCVEEKIWHEWTGPQLWYKAAGVQSGSAIVNYSISRVSTSGKIFTLNPSAVVYQDNGSTVTATIQTAKWDGGTRKRKTLDSIDIIGDQETSASTLNISWVDDDYQTPTTSRQVDLSEQSPRLTRCGAFRRRSFILSHSANTPMRLEALEFGLRNNLS